MLAASDIMVPNPITIKGDATVYEGIKLMERYDIASLIVVDETERVLGIITAKDVVLKVIAKNLDIRSTKIIDIVSRPVTVVEPDTPLKDIVMLMIGTGHGHIPVVNKSGRVLGIVTIDDVLKFIPELLELAEIKK